nr:hypothetical protein [uncultured Acetatifactor sp.]
MFVFETPVDLLSFLYLFKKDWQKPGFLPVPRQVKTLTGTLPQSVSARHGITPLKSETAKSKWQNQITATGSTTSSAGGLGLPPPGACCVSA